MRKLIAFLVLVVLAVSGAQALAAMRSVAVGDDWFVKKGHPQTVTVARGTTVTWRFTGDSTHNVVVTKGPQRFRSSLKSSGRYRHTMTRRGTYTIVCTIHAPSMRMTLKVR
jgi:plastocyanin